MKGSAWGFGWTCGGGSGRAGAGGNPNLGGGAGEPTPRVFSRVGLAARLSKFEYQNSIADVLGVTLAAAELDAAAGGIPDDTGDGVFKHVADKQTSVEQRALAYFQVAGVVAARVAVDALSNRLGTCTANNKECATAFVRAVGRLLRSGGREAQLRARGAARLFPLDQCLTASGTPRMQFSSALQRQLALLFPAW